jgi:hypothetical protein
MAAHLFDYWGWYAGPAPYGAPRSTTEAPANTSTSDTPGALRANWTGHEWIELPYAAPDPLPAPTVPVPQSVTKRQARQALLLAGLLDQVQSKIDAIPDATARGMAQIEWDDSQVYERNRPILISLGTALGLSSGDLDQLFRTAAAL